jgi:diguanylate cyclase
MSTWLFENKMLQELFAGLDIWNLHVPIPVALAVVATIGYLVGRQRRESARKSVHHSQRELRHAQTVAAELEKITWGIRKSLAKHHANVTRFKDRISRLSQQQQESTWRQLCFETEEMLKPTQQLAAQIAEAYDKIRQQSASLMSFTEMRTDPLTNVKNRRGLEDALQAQFALMARYGTPFSLIMFDIDNFKCINDKQGHLQGDRVLQDLARLLNEYVRETDIVVRYGGDEFVVVMPQTDLDGAGMFSDRLRTMVQEKTPVTVSGGVSWAIPGDTQETLLSRVDAALYKAKSSGRNCIFQHDGTQIKLLAEKEIQSVL